MGDRLATIDMGRKEGEGCCAPFGGEGAGPHLTQCALVGTPLRAGSLCSGPRPTSIPSGILVHPAVWLQQTWAENWGPAVPLFGGEWVELDRSVPPYQVTS